MKIIAFWFALIAAILATYWPALHGAFIWDDVDLIRNNPLVTAPLGLRLIWTSKEAIDFWPLMNSVFWLEWKMWGENPLAFHLVNVALHAFNCFLLHRILDRFKIPFAFAIVALFALHPMNVEAVAWIFQTKTLLSTTFVLAAFLAYLSSRSIAAVLLFTAALLTKISVVMAPVALSIYVLATTRSLRETLKRTAPFLLLSLIVGVINVTWYPYAQLDEADAIHTLNFVERLLLVGQTTLFYLWKTLVPFPVSFLHPRWDVSISDFVSWLPLTALALVAGFVVWKKKWNRESLTLLAGWIVLFPALGLFTIYFQRYSWVADHWVYVALPFFSIAIVNVVGARVHGALGLAIVALVIPAYAYISYDHASDFVSPERIWTHAIEDNDRAYLAYNNLGQLQVEANRIPEAEANFKRALEIKPDYRDSLLNLGRIAKNAGNFNEAYALYQKAAQVSPKFVSVYVNLGTLYGTVGRIDDARAAFEKALTMDPQVAFVHFNLAALYQSIGDRESALREVGLANKTSGLTAYKYGERERALEFLRAAAQNLPGDPEVRAALEDLSH